MATNPFDTHRCDLGTEAYGTGADKEYVDIMFRNSGSSSGSKCVYCGGIPRFKLIAKIAVLDSEQLRKEGFICETCITKGVVSSSDYGVREIK